MKKWIQEKLKNERGLTLVELLAVIVILAIVGTIAFVSVGKVIDNSRKDAFIADAQQMISAAKLYEAEGNTLDDDEVKLSKLVDAGFIENIVDPWEKEEVDDDSNKVTKGDDEYSVTLKGKKYKIDDKSEKDLRTEDRDALVEKD